MIYPEYFYDLIKLHLRDISRLPSDVLCPKGGCREVGPVSSGSRCVRWDDARSPLSPGLYLVLTSDVALLYRLCDVFLVWFRGSGFQIRASPATLGAVSLFLDPGPTRADLP